MQIALIGFSKSGKTTVFNALSGSKAEVSAFATGKAATHRATVTVPDERLDRIYGLYNSKKLTHARVDYVDPVGIRREDAGEGSGLGDDMLHAIATADALAAVVRAFEDDSGVDCDPLGDFEAIALELVLSDLKKVETRLERVDSQVQRVGGDQRRELEEEQALLSRMRDVLQAERPLRTVVLKEDEERRLRAFQFLTLKPLIVVVNTQDPPDAATESLLDEMRGCDQGRLADGAGSIAAPASFLALSGSIEMEIAELDPADRSEFLEGYGIETPGSERMIRVCYEALGLISFFTTGDDETRAWTVRRGAKAPEAAGEIHSDLERGFIRANVVRWDDLLQAGSLAEARKHGLLRVEGKEYVVEDGDVIEVLFSV